MLTGRADVCILIYTQEAESTSPNERRSRMLGVEQGHVTALREQGEQDQGPEFWFSAVPSSCGSVAQESGVAMSCPDSL